MARDRSRMPHTRSLSLATWVIKIAGILWLAAPLLSFTLQERFEGASSGDYVAIQQQQQFSILLVRDLQGSTLIVEEISAPLDRVKQETASWKRWIARGAPGHSSWNAYEIDLKEGKMVDAYSYVEGSWLQVEESDGLFSNLMHLPLFPLPSSSWKRIGPPPLQGETDQRAVWLPPLVIEGVKQEHPRYEAWRGTWPEDDTPLSGVQIELYFDRGRARFPFPTWLECSNGYYAFKLRAMDSGSEIASPQPHMPHRSPYFSAPPLDEGSALTLVLSVPRAHLPLTLSVLDLSTGVSLSIPFAAQSEDRGRYLMRMQKDQLFSILEEGHCYRWVITSDKYADVYAESPFILERAVSRTAPTP